jgi:hypothetical protein
MTSKAITSPPSNLTQNCDGQRLLTAEQGAHCRDRPLLPFPRVGARGVGASRGYGSPLSLLEGFRKPFRRRGRRTRLIESYPAKRPARTRHGARRLPVFVT